MVEGLRKKLREVAGISVFMRPVQNLQLGGRQSRAQTQYQHRHQHQYQYQNMLQSMRADEIAD